MSEIVRTEAVVLKSMKYRESSKIVTLYTRDYGKVSVIVKGARQAKNTYGPSLDPMSYVAIVFYRKEGRELQTLTQCDIVRPLRTLRENLETMSVGMAIIELVNMVAAGEEKNLPLFNLMIGSLSALNEVRHDPSALLLAFEIHLARILGFQPVFDRCAACGRPLDSRRAASEKIAFHLARGGPLCPDCTGDGARMVLISRGCLIALQTIAAADHLQDAASVAMTKSARTEMAEFLWSYLRYHVPGMRSLKSEKVFTKILMES